jgi:hypothetical protein
VRRWIWLLVWAGGVALLGGCQASVTPGASTKTTFDRLYELQHPVNAYVDKAFFAKTPRRVALLPLVYRPRPSLLGGNGEVASSGEEAGGRTSPGPRPKNAGGDREPSGGGQAAGSAPGGFSPDAELVRRAFYGHFATLAFSDVDIHEVDRKLHEAGIVTPEQLAGADPKWLGDLLGADALIYGSVHEISLAYVVLYSQIAVGVSLRLVSAEDGKTLWSVDDIRRNHKIHPAFGPVGLVTGAIKSGLDLRPINITRTAEDLSRDIVQTFPTRASWAHLATEPFEILAVEADDPNGHKRFGDVIRLRVSATPGRRAWFDLSPLVRNVPLREEEPGLYTGRYVVREGVDLSGPTVTVYLGPTDSPQYFRWARKRLKLRIDSLPPHPPTSLRARREGQGLLLLWAASPSGDFAEYRLYKRVAGGWVDRVGTTTGTSYLVAGPDESTIALVVTAVDEAGNESAGAEVAVAR